MSNIQKKIWLASTIVLVIMSTIWIALTFYNNKTENQYNDILQRYLSLYEVTNSSQRVIDHVNDFLVNPIPERLEQIEAGKEEVEEAKHDVISLRNSENNFTITNYVHLIDSFIETIDRFILFYLDNEVETSE